MADWRKASGENDFRTSARVEIEGHPYALFKQNEEIFALDDICSHEYSRLSEGEIWDGEVYCPKHGSRFCIKSGEVRSFPATDAVGSYPVKVEAGMVYIDIEGHS